MTFAPVDAEYLTLAANGVLTDYRILTLGNMLVAVDGGPTGPYTLNVDPTAIDHGDLDQLTAGDPHTQYMLGTILSANGDILTRAAGSPAALAIGSNDDVLQVISGAPAWAPPSLPSYAAIRPAPISGRYYGPPATSGGTSNQAVTANRLYLRPVPVPISTTFDQIACEVQTLTAGNCRLGIYGPFTGSFASLPLILDAGTVSTGTTGVKTISISQQLTPGWYMLAAVFDATPTMRSQASTILLDSTGRTAFGSGSTESNIWYAFTYGTLPSPSTTSPTYDTTASPLLQLRAA